MCRRTEEGSCTFGRAPNAIDISYGSLTCPSKHRHGPPFVYSYSEKPPHLVAFKAGDTEERILNLNPRRPHGDDYWSVRLG